MTSSAVPPSAPDPDPSLHARSLEHAPCGVLCFADDGAIRYANPVLHRWLEKAPGALTGLRFDAILSPASRVFHSTHFFPLLKLQGAADELHLTLRTASGADVPVLVSAVRDTTGPEPLNFCGVLTMRERKEFETALIDARRAAEAATAAKDQFLAVVSHELRTPLNAITGWIHMIRSGKADAAMAERAMEAIERNARLQSQLVEDLLDVSRIASGKMRISPRAINLAPIMDAAIDSARPAAQAKDIALLVAADRDAGIVQADPTRVQQIVWNLLSNAMKFTPKGGRVQVVLARAASRVAISVADTGVGIAPENLPYVFERFWQENNGSERETAGLGLGLSICRSLVELHGGSIRAESAGLGKGAVFTAEFPIAVAAPAASVGGPAVGTDESSDTTSLDGVRVLVVDDNADSRTLLCMLLEHAGARAQPAGSADDALASIARDPPHVLVSDVGMPGKDGYALIREVRAGWGHAGIAAVALTGLDRPQDRIELLRAGFQAHLAKPAEPQELIALIRALAPRAREQRVAT